MSSLFNQENSESRRRLENLLQRLSIEDLSRSNSSGWTVASLLAHLSFWDQRVVILLRRWKANGVDESPVDANVTNDSIKPLCLALDPKAAVDLCLRSAIAADSEVETLSTELIEAIQASPNHFRFNRALHRNDHLDEIERLLHEKL